MPRGSSAGASTSSGKGAGSRGSLRGADQALHIVTQMRDYFHVGMDHILEVANDMSEHGVNDEGQLNQLRQLMLSYVGMERDIDTFTAAAKEVMAEASEGGEGLETRLAKRVEEKGRGNDDLQQHDKVTELEQKISDTLHPDGMVDSGGGEVAEGVELTQQELNTRCPYTGRQMEQPVRNTICRHAYDRDGIMHYIKQRGKKATCPVIGCSNKKPIVPGDLEDYKEMRRYIQAQAKKKK